MKALMTYYSRPIRKEMLRDNYTCKRFIGKMPLLVKELGAIRGWDCQIVKQAYSGRREERRKAS